MKRVNFFWKGQNTIIREILSSVKSVIQNYLQELLPQKQATPLVFGGNYARSSWMFESGFLGFCMMRWRSWRLGVTKMAGSAPM